MPIYLTNSKNVSISNGTFKLVLTEDDTEASMAEIQVLGDSYLSNGLNMGDEH